MFRPSSSTFFAILALGVNAYASIGPIADLVVSNAVVSLDGYERDAIVVNGVFPAPLITGKKVSRLSCLSSLLLTFHRVTGSCSM